MRAAVLFLLLPYVFVVTGCKKETAASDSRAIPTTVLTAFCEEKTPTACETATLPRTSASSEAATQPSSEPEQARHSAVESTLQRNQQILEGLLRRLVATQPSTR